MDENPISQAIARLGGMTRAVVRTGYSEASWHRWRRTKRIPDAIACLRVARLTGIQPELLAGDELAPTGTDAPRARPHGAVVEANGEALDGNGVRPGEAAASLKPRKNYGTVLPSRRHTPSCSPHGPVFLLPIYHRAA